MSDVWDEDGGTDCNDVLRILHLTGSHEQRIEIGVQVEFYFCLAMDEISQKQFWKLNAMDQLNNQLKVISKVLDYKWTLEWTT